MAKFKYEVNGRFFETNDQIEDGETILERGGFEPASEHVLIQLNRPGSSSIGLDDKVDFSDPGREAFRAFKSDRVFLFTLNERGYEWGAATIEEPELRDIAEVPVGHILVLERRDTPDEEIEAGTRIDLAARGTEHIRSEKRLTQIIVNARPHEVDGDEINYAKLVALAFDPVPSGPDVTFSITYSKGPRPSPEGSVPEGGSVPIKNRMIFVVTQTNRS